MAGFRRQRVKDLSKDKHEKLSDNLLYAKFSRDVAEVKLSLLTLGRLHSTNLGVNASS